MQYLLVMVYLPMLPMSNTFGPTVSFISSGVAISMMSSVSWLSERWVDPTNLHLIESSDAILSWNMRLVMCCVGCVGCVCNCVVSFSATVFLSLVSSCIGYGNNVLLYLYVYYFSWCVAAYCMGIN